MAILRNARHEAFCREYMKCASGKRAYLAAYPPNLTAQSAAVGGYRLLNKPVIKRRISELQMEIKRKADITIEKILNNYQEALDMARALAKPGEMISAAREQAKLVGLLVERREIGEAGDFDKMDSVEEILNAVKTQVSPEAAKALAQAFGYSETIETEDSTELLKAEPGSEAVN